MLKHPHHSDEKTAFMCGVAWQHEVGETTVELFENAKTCEQERSCTSQCGVVKVAIRLLEWVKGQDLFLKDNETPPKHHHHCPEIRCELKPENQHFNHCVSICFEDGSKAEFEYAFAKKTDKTIEVYTEHCGYHAFPLLSVKKISILGARPHRHSGRTK